jgi:hypothetical protein
MRIYLQEQADFERQIEMRELARAEHQRAYLERLEARKAAE